MKPEPSQTIVFPCDISDLKFAPEENSFAITCGTALVLLYKIRPIKQFVPKWRTFNKKKEIRIEDFNFLKANIIEYTWLEQKKSESMNFGDSWVEAQKVKGEDKYSETGNYTICEHWFTTNKKTCPENCKDAVYEDYNKADVNSELSLTSQNYKVEIRGPFFLLWKLDENNILHIDYVDANKRKNPDDSSNADEPKKKCIKVEPVVEAKPMTSIESVHPLREG